ncbi:MAG: hypothetical protein EZS28_041371 [Streblomastix strix]|uniref:Uncharacterized protein n=1 Tax=Streblomastix strix TaxID=222440 RepID=A0A5J4TZB6_9EUKA|nr:MAG: hypothetical protein EZS28_041371 [Streblomastix strix]
MLERRITSSLHRIKHVAGKHSGLEPPCHWSLYTNHKTLQKLQLPDVDEFLVGSASLKPDFVTVVKKESQMLFDTWNSLQQVSFLECEAQSDTSSTSPTRYGGGIFLTGTRDYNSSTKRLDFKGMKIYGNVADKAGQRLYVGMNHLVE